MHTLFWYNSAIRAFCTFTAFKNLLRRALLSHFAFVPFAEGMVIIMPETHNNILIVEDSSLGVKILQDILGKDYILHIARDGQEGIDMAKSLIPDLIILDIILPHKDGYEVIAELKSFSETKDIPIIFVTALNKPDDEKKGLLLGGSDYINKPYDPTVVKLRVDVQIRMINQLRTIRLLSSEIETWMKGAND